MKKKNLIKFTFFAFIMFFLSSCQKDISETLTQEKGISIADAKQWYESNKPQGVRLAFAKVKASKGKLSSKPSWEHAYKEDNTDFTTVKVPLSVQGAFCFITPERKQMYEQTGDKRYLESLTQMVVMNNKKNNSTIGFLMTIIPDAEYQKITKFKAFYSSYKKWQKGYSGLIFYHTIEGKFTNGWRLENGKVIASITPKEDSGIDIQLNAPTADKSSTRQNVQVYGCRDYYYEIWSQDCTDWYTQSEYSSSYNGTTCGSWYIDGYQYAYTQCEYYDDGSGGNVIIPSTGGGGPSGGTGGGTVNLKPQTLNQSLTNALIYLLERLTGDINSTLQNLINNYKINFTPVSTGSCGALISKWSDGTNGVLFQYDNNFVNSSSTFGLEIVCIHEMYHIYRQIGSSNAGSDNDIDHFYMVTDPQYLMWLKQAFTGYSDSFYNDLRYAGTIGSPIWNNLPYPEKIRLVEFFAANNIPY